MAYLLNESDKFVETLKALRKKDRQMYERVKRKIEEIISDPHHYKPLSNALKGYKRAHIGSFVIAFRIIEEQQMVRFVAYEHHDNIYKRSFNE